MSNNATIANLNKLRGSRDFLAVAAEVVARRAHAAAVKAECAGYMAEVFAACGPFRMPERGTRARAAVGGSDVITDPDRLYLCEDEAQTAAYYAALTAAHAAHGWAIPDGHCPVLRAESAAGQAETRMLAIVAEVAGVDFRQAWAIAKHCPAGRSHWTVRDAAVDNLLGLAATLPGFRAMPAAWLPKLARVDRAPVEVGLPS